MNAGFQPQFEEFQEDIEEYIRAMGRVERRGELTFFFGYSEALDRMWQLYLDRQAFDPLLAHLRNWNPEVGDGRYLLELSEALHIEGDWPRLRLLWMRVYKKRGRLYNEMRRLNRKIPGTVPDGQVEHLQALITGTLDRLLSFADEFDKPEDADLFLDLRSRIQKGLNARVRPADL